MADLDRTVFITGPDPSLKLLYSDVWLPGLYSRRILCFELPERSSHEKVVDVVQRALKALVQGTPELGATVVVQENADPNDSSKPWRALVPGNGIELVIKDMTKSFHNYQSLQAAGFPLSAFEDAKFMPVAGPIMPEPQPEAKFQLSLIEGGALLSVCLYHHLTDGNGMNTITRALGEECKRAAEMKGNLPPRILNIDRSVMASLNGGKTDIADHPANAIIEGVYAPGAHHDEAPSETNGEPAPTPPQFVPAYFHLGHEEAQALKDYCSRDTPVSTHDAISALLWRNLTLSRIKTGELKRDTLCTFTGPHNGRKHVGLPKEWVGNCVYFYLTQATAAAIIEEESLPALAAKIRTALNKVDREHMEGISTIRKRDPFSLAWWPVGEASEPHMTAITSFYHSELLGTDWGAALGSVTHFTCTDIGAFGSTFQRSHFVGPKLLGGRGADVHVGLLKEEVEHFHNDALWRKYFSLRELRATPNQQT